MFPANLVQATFQQVSTALNKQTNIIIYLFLAKTQMRGLLSLVYMCAKCETTSSRGLA